MEKKNGLSSDEISELIYNAIKDEKFFDKKLLVSKIRAIISIFRFKQNEKSYNNLETPTRYSKALRENEKLEMMKNFWKNKVKQLDPTNLSKYYAEADTLEKEKGFRKS